MKRLFSILLLLVSVQFVLGQEVVTLPKSGSNKVIVKLNFRAGSICDPVGKEGLTALTARLITGGGTQDLTKTEIDSILYPMAASYGVSVDKEVSVFTFQVPTDFADAFLPIMRELLLAPAFSEKDFNRIKAQQLNYVTRGVRNSSDEDYSKFVLEQQLYAGTNYAHMVAGTAEGVEAITLEDVKAHYRKFFTKDNILIGIAGNYSQDFLEDLKAAVGELPALETALPEPGKGRMPNGIEATLVAKPGAFGSAIYMGAPIEVTRADDEYAALLVAASWLGEHRKSYGRLYQEIRSKRSMNYGDYAYIEWYPSGSYRQLPMSGYTRSNAYFSLWIRPVQLGAGLRQQYPELADVTLGHAHFATRMALYQTQQMIENGLSQEDFELTRDFLRSYIKLYVSDINQELGYLMDARFFDRQDWITTLDGLLANLTREEVNAAIKKHIQIDNLYYTAITTPEEAQLLRTALLSNKPSPMSYSNVVKDGLNEEILALDKVVETFPLNVKKVEIVDSQETLQ